MSKLDTFISAKAIQDFQKRKELMFRQQTDGPFLVFLLLVRNQSLSLSMFTSIGLKSERDRNFLRSLSRAGGFSVKKLKRKGEMTEGIVVALFMNSRLLRTIKWERGMLDEDSFILSWFVALRAIYSFLTPSGKNLVSKLFTETI